MAPERFRDARGVDLGADPYSFGVVLYQMFTSELLFTGGSISVFERKHAKSEPPSLIPFLSKRCPREAEPVDRFVRRCVAKDPEDGFRTSPVSGWS